MILVPPGPSLRLFSAGTETAHYLFIWARRLIVTWVVGYYASEAALLLGLPLAAHAGLIRLVGLLITVMVVVFLLQNRAAVAEWIRGHRTDAPPTAARRLRRRLADVWHVLAIVYVVGVFAVWALNIEGGFEYLFRATVASALILVAARLLAAVLRRGINRGFAVSEEVRHRFPLLEARVNRYVPVIHLVLRVVLYVVATLALLQAWGLDTLAWLQSPFGQRITGSLFSIALVLVLSLILWEGVSSSIERYLTQTGADGLPLQRSARARTLLPLLRTTIMVIMLVMVTLIVLSELGVNIGPLLAGAGVIGLAVGFGSQKLVQDVINGIFILVEDSLAVGDVVTASGISGVVEQISIRSLRLRGLDGTVHTIPFSTVDTRQQHDQGLLDGGHRGRRRLSRECRRGDGGLEDSGRRDEGRSHLRAADPGAAGDAGRRRLWRFGGDHQVPVQDAAAQAVDGDARVQPAHEEPFRRTGHRDPLPAPDGLFRCRQEGQGAARLHPDAGGDAATGAAAFGRRAEAGKSRRAAAAAGRVQVGRGVVPVTASPGGTARGGR
jgi:small-conductance mechanosensitive channel